MRQAYGYGQGNAALFAKHHEHFGTTRWIDLRWHAWALKALVKAPFVYALNKDPVDKRMAWHDALSNAAQAYGRFKGGLKHGVRVI